MAKTFFSAPPQLGAGDLEAGINPEIGSRKKTLQIVCHFPAAAGDGHRSGGLLDHLPGETRAGEDGVRHGRAQFFPYHSFHGQEGVNFHALGGAYQHCLAGQVGAQLPEHFPEAVGRNGHEGHPHPLEGHRKFLGEHDPGRQPHPRQKGVIDPVPAQSGKDLRLPDPDPDRHSLVRQELGQGGAPGAGADHRHRLNIR